eukprot:TRINITY_DN75745_c0_g1_i1.p1 TRINITY_DN75745_c0_g1~~TRINITY_DN75745_c0_g1_i1.p1  ORF type:complete len:548 (-),score=143.65 TRINITY_DN75745_c0_g1_i1:34-1677(-)
MLLVAPASAIRTPERPLAEGDWKRVEGSIEVNVDSRKRLEAEVRPPLPPLSPEEENAVKILNNEVADNDAIIAAARILSLSPEVAAPHAALLARRLRHEDSEVRRVMAYAISQLGVVAASSHASALVDSLCDEDAGMQMMLKNILQATGSQGAAALAAKVKVDDGRAAKAAMQILQGMGADGAEALAEELRRASDAASTRRLVTTLMRTGKAATPYLATIADLLSQKDEGVRRDVVEALGRAGEAAGPYVHDVAKLLEGDSSERCCALEALERIGKPAAGYTASVSVALLDADRSVQLKALKALGGIAAASLDPDPLTDAADGAWTLPDDGVRAMLLHLKQQSKGAAEALKLMGCLGAAILSTQLCSKSSELRKRCLEALVGMGPRDPESVGKKETPRELHVGAGALAMQLSNSDPGVRVLMCGALGSCAKNARGHAWTLKELWDGNGKPELQDSSPEVRKAAMTAITKMGSKKGSETNVLLTDPTIVAMSVPAQTKRDAEQLVDIIRSMVTRVSGLQNASSTDIVKAASQQKSSSFGCLPPFFRKH